MWLGRWGGFYSKAGRAAAQNIWGRMTNKLALWLGLLITAAVLGDIFLNGGAALLFLLRKFAIFIEYLSFWR